VHEQLEEFVPLIGNTPVRKLKMDNINLYMKLERLNMTDSIKDRAAYTILSEAIRSNAVKKGSLVVESSSGNFAIAAATMCNYIGLKFIAIIDDNANDVCKKLIGKLSHDVIVATKRDASGGFIESRLENVKLFCEKHNAFWANQYANPANYRAHYNGTGIELTAAFDKLDYVFVGLGTCGTIGGVSRRVKEKFPECKVIAVDTEGSLILKDHPTFHHSPQPRHIAGLGLNFPSTLLKNAIYDSFAVVTEPDTIRACYELLDKHSEFVGGSTGTIYHAIKEYFADKKFETPPNVAMINCDGGGRYINTIYSDEWVEKTYGDRMHASKTHSYCAAI
jgi:cysteine synthase A